MKYNIVRFRIGHGGDAVMHDGIMQSAKDVLSALAGEAGFESFEETDEGINGYIQQAQMNRTSLNNIIQSFPIPGIKISYSVEEAEDINWNSEWEKEGFPPICIENRCVIHDTGHIPEQTDNDILDITIDAQQAFGTGTHETTRMIVTKLLNTDLTNKSVLDCGCGTGILSIVASKCGACTVIGYDIDEWSVRNTNHNAAINNVDNILTLHGDVSVIAGRPEKFDIVLANINRNILLNDMPVITSKMKRGSYLIISGFYKTDEQMLKDRGSSLGLTFDMAASDGEWSMMGFRL